MATEKRGLEQLLRQEQLPAPSDPEGLPEMDWEAMATAIVEDIKHLEPTGDWNTGELYDRPLDEQWLPPKSYPKYLDEEEERKLNQEIWPKLKEKFKVSDGRV